MLLQKIIYLVYILYIYIYLYLFRHTQYGMTKSAGNTSEIFDSQCSKNHPPDDQ